MSIFTIYFKLSNFSTMRKYFILFLLAIASTFSMQAQLSVSFTGGNVDPGGQIEVDVVVADFNNLFGVQYSINWDSLVLEYDDIINVTSDLSGFDQNAVGVPGPGSVNVNPGQLTVSWFQSNTNSLPDDTRLFTIVFNGQNVPCDSTEVAVTGVPLAIEVTDENFMNIGVTSTPAKVYINGPNCDGGMGGGDELKFYVENDVVLAGDNICVPILMENFINFNGGQGKLGWDPAVLTFTGVQNQIPGSFNDNQNNVGMGMYNFLWENLDPGNPVTLPDGSTLFEICFDAVGADGEMSVIDLESFESDWGFTDDTGAEPPLVLENGKITITIIPPVAVILTISSITIDQNGNACVGISVDNFTDILSFQGTFAFNSTVADFTGTQGFGALAGLDTNDFNEINDNNVRLIWSAPGGSINGETLPDGTELFQICFDGVGACDAVSLLDFIDVTDLDVEFTQVQSGTPVTIEHTINSGMITIDCPMTPVTCMITEKSDVLCNGDNTGSIKVSVEIGTTPDCQCVWYKDGSATPFMTLSAPNCDLANIGAGDYRLEVVCGGNVETTCDTTINQPTAILINGMVTNIGCGQTTGSIILNPEGGVPGYGYSWDDGPMTKDRDNLPAGTYTVTVTDLNLCTESREFTISDMSSPLAVDTTVTHVGCFGDMTGEIALTISGGCPDGNGNYNVMPSDLTGLGAGVYMITVSDFDSPSNEVVISVTISQPDMALIITGTTTPSTGSDGTITTEIDGGTENYTITWTGGIPDGTMNPTGLAPDTYIMTVVDANGCTTSEVFIVGEVNPMGPTITEPVANDAVCNGDSSGSVDIIITAGEDPFNTTLVNANSEVVATVTSDIPGPVMLTGVPAGIYNVIVTDANGNDVSAEVVVNEPPLISIVSTVECANGSSTDGSIDITVEGGVGNFMYEWSSGDFTEDLSNVGVGSYSLLVEDGNSCQAIANGIRIVDCNPTNCYEAIHIITPNGDGYNDNFVINCVMQNNTRLTIYDRWGEQVFTQQNYDNTWQGIDTDNEEVRESAYMWVLEVDFADNRQEVFKGTVTVLRAE
jgi:gliding motility-associated-like protein